MKGTLLGALFICVLSIGAFSQAKTQKFAGKVTDASTGSPLVGATVMVPEAKTGTRADVDGNFFLVLETDKKYTIEISNVGYKTKQITDVQVSLDNNVANISLERSSGDLGNVIVKASARKESVATLYSIQRNSSAISDAISAEVIKKSPDRNTSEVLRRVSGTSIQDNKFVIIRGLAERYNTSLLNNSVLPSTEPDKKAFSFDIIPSSLIDNITIYKSATPDLPGDFAGGAIKIITRDFPTRKVSELAISLSYNSQTTFKNFYKGFPDGKWDNLGFLGNSRLMPGPYARHRGDKFIIQSNDFKQSVTKMFPNTFGYEEANVSQPNIGVSFTNGNTKLFTGNKKLGYIYSVSYSTGRKAGDLSRDEYLVDKQFQYEYNTNTYEVRNSVSALLNLTYSYNRSKISWKNLFNNDFVKAVGIRNGYNAVNAPDLFYYKSAISEATQNGIANSVIEGSHHLADDWSIDWNASYGLTYRWQPDQRILTFRTDYNNASNYYLMLSNENSPEIRNAGRIYSFLYENIYGANANAIRQFNWLGLTQKLKFGTSNYLRSRNAQVDALGYAALYSNSAIIPESKNANLSSLGYDAIDTYGLTLANIPSNSTDYSGNALLNAGYVMLDNRFSNKIKLTWGVRTERYWQQLQARHQNNLTKEDIDVLPSFLFTYSLNNKTNFRASASESVNRPEFRELAAYSVYDYENYFVVKGNPDLVRSKNLNTDLRYEWFPSAGEIVSASLFYKTFNNPIEQVNKGNDVLSYENADNATAYGAEIEIRKKLNFINSAFLHQLTVYTNAALVKGHVKIKDFTFNNPLQGQSPYLVNGGITYNSADDGFSVNVLYNKIGSRLKFRAANGGNQSIYERSRNLLDFQVSKKLLAGKLEVKFTASDLLAQPYVWYYKFNSSASHTNYDPSEDKIINSIKYGSTLTLGVKYNLGK